MSDVKKFLSRQVALVTGSSGGIGAACAIELARRGASVIINYRSSKVEAETIVQCCHAQGVDAIAVQADVSQEAQVDDLFKCIDKKFSRLDILVANAGIQQDASFLEMEFDQWQKVINVNLTGQFLCAQRAARKFCAQGIDPKISCSAGKIVHISSVHDKIPWAGHVNYASSKGGVKLLMESIALELARNKIRVNSISPGAIKTNINEEVWQDKTQARELLELIPYSRIGEPEDVAKPLAWLVSDEADYITGTTFYIDGGMTLYPGFLDNG